MSVAHRFHPAIDVVNITLSVLESDEGRRLAIARLIVRDLVETRHIRGEISPGLTPLAIEAQPAGD